MTARQFRLAILSVHSSPIGNIGAKDTGGMSIYIREVAREMGKRGVLVDIYTRVHEPGYAQIVELGENARLIHLRAGDDGEIEKLAIYPHLPVFAGNLEDFRQQNNLQYDLIFSHYWLSGWVGDCLQRWWHIPHLMMFHTIGAVKNAIGIGDGEPVLRLDTERGLAGDGHYLVVSTRRERGDLVRYYGAMPERIRVIPCGVNLELFRPGDKEESQRQLGLGSGRVVLFVGRIEPLKGIDQLMRAMTYLPDSQRAKLVIIGGDEHSQHEMERLRGLSRELRITESVSFLGTIRHEELPRYYCAADVCVVPSYYESFGLVALESLACGTLVVANNVGNLRNIIRQGKTGYVVDNNDPRLLAEKISLVLARPVDGRESELIRESVTRFGWPNIARALMVGCQQVLAEHLVV